MYWAPGSHSIALEEVLASNTTLLLQHVTLNPDLWLDPARPRPVTWVGQEAPVYHTFAASQYRRATGV